MSATPGSGRKGDHRGWCVRCALRGRESRQAHSSAWAGRFYGPEKLCPRPLAVRRIAARLICCRMRAPIELDLHLPNFNYPGVGPEGEFEKLVEIATAAERAGFTSVTLMDHYHQIAPVGPPQNWMFEGNTMLAGIAARTQSINVGLLVGGVAYRNPAQHAKITTTLDVISRGRAIHGIGAGWFEGEHRAYGFEFPSLKERFERLEDHLRIARAMFTEEQATVAGEHHSVDGAYNNPKPLRGDIPILIGGAGSARRCGWSPSTPTAATCSAPPKRAKHLLGVLERPLRERRARSGGDHEDVDADDRDRRNRGGRPSEARLDAPASGPRSASPPSRRAHPSRSSRSRRPTSTSASRGSPSRCPTCTTSTRWLSPARRSRRCSTPSTRPPRRCDRRAVGSIEKHPRFGISHGGYLRPREGDEGLARTGDWHGRLPLDHGNRRRRVHRPRQR